MKHHEWQVAEDQGAHADAQTGHPIARSVEPGEEWPWCYADELFLEPAG